MFGTDDFIKGYNEQKRKLSETPRSVHSMTNIYLPKIHQDFPEFDYELSKCKAQAVLRGYFNAITTGSTATLPEGMHPQTLKIIFRKSSKTCMPTVKSSISLSRSSTTRRLRATSKTARP